MLQYTNISQDSTKHFVELINQFLNFNKSVSENKHHVKEVQNQLKVFSKSDTFFQIAYDFIMNKADATYEQLFIVSLLLRDKFRYGFDKYSDEQTICQLENMLKQILRKYNEHPPDTFSTNICVCIICLYIKRAQSLKIQFNQVGILEYYKSFVMGNICSDYFYKALEYTPEEIYSSKIVMDEVMKDRVKSLLRNSQYEVLKHLNIAASELWQKKIIKKCHLFAALQNWISLGYKETLFHQLPNHFLVQKLFQCCLDPNVSTQATDCLKAIIKKLKSTQKDEGLFLFLGNGVLKLVEAIRLSIEQSGEGTQINEAIEVVTDFGILATQFFITNYNQDVKKFLQSTIRFIKIQDFDVYPNLVDFWEGFINEVHRLESKNSDFDELFKSAYAAICFRTKWSSQMVLRMNQISQRNLGKFYNEAQYIAQRRHDSQNFFQSLSLTFGKQKYLEFVLGCIGYLSREEPQQFGPCLQCYLFSLRNALKNFPGVTQSLKLLVATYTQVNEHIAIKNAYMNIFKSLMTIKQNNIQLKGQFIKHLFGQIAKQLSNHKVADKAEKAFSKGCQQNPQIVIHYIQDFISLLKTNGGNEQIVKGIMHVLSHDVQTLQKYLPSVLIVQYEVFIQAAKGTSNLKRKHAYNSLYSLFKILMGYNNKQHFRQILVEFTKTLWPSLLNSLKQPKDAILDEDPEIQRAVKLIKFIMRCLKSAFIPFLQSLFTTVFQAYQKYPICSYIYVLEVSITVFYDNESLHEYFRTLYQNFCQITYSHLKLQESIEDYQLLIDDFIGMNKRFFIYNSKIVLQSGQLPSLIETCINLSNMVDVPQVSKSAYQFFETIFMVYWSDDFIKTYNDNEQGDRFQKDKGNQMLYNQLKTFIIPKLPQIIMKMINHLQKVPLQATTNCILDALISQIKGFSEVNTQIWTPILQGIPRQILTNSQKAQIYDNLTRINSSVLDEARQSDSRVSRLIYIMNKRFINNHKRKI